MKLAPPEHINLLQGKSHAFLAKKDIFVQNLEDCPFGLVLRGITNRSLGKAHAFHATEVLLAMELVNPQVILASVVNLAMSSPTKARMLA